MDALVNYSSDEDQDDNYNEISAQQIKTHQNHHQQKRERERERGNSGHKLKHSNQRSRHSRSRTPKKSSKSRSYSSDTINSGNSSDSNNLETSAPIKKTFVKSSKEYNTKTSTSVAPTRSDSTSVTRYRGSHDNGRHGSSHKEQNKASGSSSTSSRRRDNRRNTKDWTDESSSERRKLRSERDYEKHSVRSERERDYEKHCAKSDRDYRRDTQRRDEHNRKLSKHDSVNKERNYRDADSRNEREDNASSSLSTRDSGVGCSIKKSNNSGGNGSRYSDVHSRHSHYKNQHRSYDERSSQRRHRDSRSPSSPSSRSGGGIGKHERRSRHYRSRESHSRSNSRSPSRSCTPDKRSISTKDHHQNSRTSSSKTGRLSAADSPITTSQNVELRTISSMEIPSHIGTTASTAGSAQHSPSTLSLSGATSQYIPPLMSLPLSTVIGESLTKQTLSNTTPPLVSTMVYNRAPSDTAAAAAAAAGVQANAGGIQLPSYYNPSVINATKYAEQAQKRKLLWSSKKTEDSACKWGHAQFSQDSDGKVASKFMRLMGIKNAANNAAESDAAGGVGPEAATVAGTTVPVDVQSRERMFSSMEKQYEVARQATHTMRGVGLGFGTQPRTF